MANPFMQGQPSPRMAYEQKYKTSRMNLLSVVIFTAINLLLLVTNSGSYFLFSAFIPYFITSIGMFVCGHFPEEYYTNGLEQITSVDNSIFVVLLVFSFVLTFLYLVAWFMSSKQRVGWLIFALAFFGIDTLGMIFINGFSFESILDILFHAWVIYYLILGIVAHYKLKKLPPEESMVFPDGTISQQIEGNGETSEPVISDASNSYIISEADKDVR